MELVFDSNGFQNLSREVKSLKEEFEKSINEAEQFQSNVLNSSWEGKTKDEFVAFLDLLVQYHKKLYESPDFNSTEIENFSNSVDNLLDSYTSFLALE